MILNPSIRVAGFANFFPFRSVIVPTLNGTNSMNWRSARLPETGKCLIALRKSDSTRRRRGIHGVKTEIRIGRIRTTQTARGLMRVRRKASRRKPGIRSREATGGRQGGSIVVPSDRLERIRETAVREMVVRVVLEAAVQGTVVPEALRPPDSNKSDKRHPDENGNRGCRFSWGADSARRFGWREPEAFAFAFLLDGREEFLVFAALVIARTDDEVCLARLAAQGLCRHCCLA